MAVVVFAYFLMFILMFDDNAEIKGLPRIERERD